jgi:uncharacterized integral membrane protein (TIGR00698 family)
VVGVTERAPSPFRGLLLVALVTAAAYAASAAVGTLASPLLLALVLGIAWRSLPPGRDGLGRAAAGVRLAAGPLLKLGIVALGVRLDARLLLELGPALLAGSVLGVLAAVAAVEGVGRLARVPRELRALVAIGTAICGASAIVSAAPLWRARAEHVSAGIGAISLLGTLGVLGFALWDAIALVPVALLGALAGATLQEMGQVLAAGSVQGEESADLALLVKLSRVVLLAPVLLVSAALVARAGGAGGAGGAAATGSGPRALPPFVLGFLALGALVSLGLVPEGVAAGVASVGTGLTAAAMAAIGLGVDVRALRRSGVQALALGAVGMLALVVTMLLYYGAVLR